MPDGTPDNPMAAAETTIRDRLLNAGVDAASIDRYFAAGVVRVAGEPTTGPDQLCPWPMSYVIGGSS